jgi:alkylhydroperoxidase family enzyme
VLAVVEDWRTAPVDERLRRVLGFLDKLTRTPDEVTPEDVRNLREVGLSDPEIQDAIYICATYCIIDRIADAFDFQLPDDEDMRKTAKFLLKIGYRA